MRTPSAPRSCSCLTPAGRRAPRRIRRPHRSRRIQRTKPGIRPCGRRRVASTRGEHNSKTTARSSPAPHSARASAPSSIDPHRRPVIRAAQAQSAHRPPYQTARITRRPPGSHEQPPATAQAFADSIPIPTSAPCPSFEGRSVKDECDYRAEYLGAGRGGRAKRENPIAASVLAGCAGYRSRTARASAVPD